VVSEGVGGGGFRWKRDGRGGNRGGGGKVEVTGCAPAKALGLYQYGLKKKKQEGKRANLMWVPE
jgi:hypothetical protein